MAQTAALVNTLKQALKQNQLTYAEVAQRLNMSEANIKRLFATERITLSRLEEICNLMQMELTDLFQLYETSRLRIEQLTIEQERELVNDIKLLLVAVSVRNRLSFSDIVTYYQIEETECIRCLAKLDKIKIIDLLPNNHYKLRIDENFRWLRNGPIECFFEQQIQSQFLHSKFNKELEQRLFQFGLLGDVSVNVLIKKMQALSWEFTNLHRQDSDLPMRQRHTMGLMLAIRPWEFEAFKPLRYK